MDAQSFCNILGIKGLEGCRLQERWASVTEDWKGEMPFFLQEEYFEKIIPYVRAPYTLEELRPYVREVLRIVNEHKELALLGHIVCKAAFEQKEAFSFKFPNQELPFLGEQYSGVFCLMVSMGIYPYLRKVHESMGIPEKYTQDILAWLGGTMLAYGQAHHNLPGRALDFGWLVRYVQGTLFRVGRFEYLMHPAPEWLTPIYRNSKGKLKVLCGNNWTFRADKRRAFLDEEVVWTSYLHETEETITGIPCDPYGEPDFDHPVTLDKKEWQSVLSPWDLCPSIHIPAGGRMPVEEVISSMKEAVTFFQTYFKRHIKVICCCSWILNRSWETLFENSNMARFRQECYAIPAPSWGPLAGMGFIFGRSDMPPTDLPAVNTVQKVYQEAYRQKLVGTGAIFVLTDELDQLGDQYYRKKYSVR